MSKREAASRSAGTPIAPPVVELCPFGECRYCVHRVNARSTPDGEGRCALVIQGRIVPSLCRGRVFFSVAADRVASYRAWVVRGA